MRAFAYASFYGIYGPLVAVMVLMLEFMLGGFGAKTEPADVFFGLPALIPMGLLMFAFALVIGILPGAFTGLIYWWVNERTYVGQLPSMVKAAGMSLVGGIACVLLQFCFGAAPSELLASESLQLLVVPGMVAAFVCTILVDRQIRRRSSDR